MKTIKRRMLGLLLLIVIVGGSATWLTWSFAKGTHATIEKSAVVERIRAIEQVATAEAHIKAVIEREDNQLFGKEIGVNMPGTKRKLLVIMPGVIRAGVDLDTLTEEDVTIDYDQKTATLALPPIQFLGSPSLDFDHVDIFSAEGLFRSEANMKEAYTLANEAKALIVEEAEQQGLKEVAAQNAEQLVKELFAFEGFTVTVTFKE